MLPIAIRFLTSALALFMFCWIRPRLDCQFFSAFEYAQASIIISSLPVLARIVGFQHWFYRRFFSRFHTGLLSGFYFSAIILILQFILSDIPFYVFAAIYAFVSFFLIIVIQRGRIEGRDQRRHLPYNQFAPLHEKQRRELAAQRNNMQISGLISRTNFSNNEAESESNSEKRKLIEEKYKRY